LPSLVSNYTPIAKKTISLISLEKTGGDYDGKDDDQEEKRSEKRKMKPNGIIELQKFMNREKRQTY
jgi:hypothetical protein